MKSANKIFIAVLGLVLVFLLIYNIYMLFMNDDKTQIAVMGKIENSIPVKGYVIRDEEVLVPENGKVVSSLFENGERVSKGALVAVVYNTDTDYETRVALSTVNAKIDKLEKLDNNVTSTLVNGDVGIRTKVDNLIFASNKANGGGIEEAKLRLEDAVTTSLASNDSDVKSLLAELKEQKKSIEQSITGEKNRIYASKAGIYLTSIDGYEGIFNFNNISEITPSFLKNVDNLKTKEAENSVIKIADNYSWYFATLVDTKDVMAEKVGQSVYIRLSKNEEDLIPVTIADISKSEDDKSVIILKGGKYVEQLYKNNNISLEIVLDSREGLKISKDAIKIVDGVKGVYIIKKGVYRFREVNILASDEEYVVIERNLSTDVPHLALYDEVVVRGYNGD